MDVKPGDQFLTVSSVGTLTRIVVFDVQGDEILYGQGRKPKFYSLNVAPLALLAAHVESGNFAVAIDPVEITPDW